jgi:hypothetical protein
MNCKFLRGPPENAARRANRGYGAIAIHDLIPRARDMVDCPTFEGHDFGTSIRYPASIFTPARKPEKGLGQRFERVKVERAVAADWHPLWLAELVRFTSPDAAPPISSTKTECTDMLSASFPRGGVTVRGNDSLTLRCHFVHLVHCRGTRQMLTSGQMLFTMAVFGHVLIAGITLLIAVALDDSM